MLIVQAKYSEKVKSHVNSINTIFRYIRNSAVSSYLTGSLLVKKPITPVYKYHFSITLTPAVKIYNSFEEIKCPTWDDVKG